MNAIPNCREAIKGIVFNNTNWDVQDLKQLLDQAQHKVKQATLPRVAASVNQNTTNQRITPAAATKTKARQQIQNQQPQVFLPSQPPALSTRSKVWEAAKSKATVKPAAPKCSSCLMQPTKSSIQRNMKQALSAQLQSPKGCKDFIRQYKQMERKVERAMLVLDEESGKLLKYKDLLRHPNYKKQWSISAADEFGRLA